MFVSPDAENDSDFLLAADGFADEFDYVYVLYGNVPLMSGSSLKNALSLCVNEGMRRPPSFQDSLMVRT